MFLGERTSCTPGNALATRVAVPSMLPLSTTISVGRSGSACSLCSVRRSSPQRLCVSTTTVIRLASPTMVVDPPILLRLLHDARFIAVTQPAKLAGVRPYCRSFRTGRRVHVHRFHVQATLGELLVARFHQ